MHALITGGGIGGLTAALCLAHAGHRVSLFEQVNEIGEIGAGIQLSPNCSRVLHHLGLQQALEAIAFLPQHTEMRHWKNAKFIASTPLGDTVHSRFGAPYYHVHRADLMRVLFDAASAVPAIALHTGARVNSVVDRGDRVELTSDAQTVEGDLLIGADGIHSTIRAALWGEAEPAFTGNIAWRALVPAERLPADLVRPASTVWWGPGRHFVHYYVRRGELVNCVCVVEKTGWEIESWTARGERAELEADFAGWHNNVQQLIKQADEASLFKWALFDRPPMPQWGKGCITLLGDACHPTLPFMAQGAAMAIEDAAVLAACIEKAGEVEGALQRYEDLRRDRTAGIQRGSRRNAKIFHLSGVQAWLRNRAAARAGGRTLDGLFAYDALSVADTQG
ncbi:MAG: FAD-dependent monooxygenase [Pseudomonadota bacterium]